MPLWPDSFGEDIVFRLSRSFVHPFIRSDIFTNVSHERPEQFNNTDREYLLAPTDDWLDMGDQRSSTQQAIVVKSCEHCILWTRVFHGNGKIPRENCGNGNQN